MWGKGFLGRIINTLGEPLDGRGPIQGKTWELPLERKAPGVIYRQPVKEPHPDRHQGHRFDDPHRTRTA